MKSAPAINRLSKLAEMERRFCQILAVADESMKPGDLAKFYKSVAWPRSQPKQLTVAETKLQTDSLVKKGILTKEIYSSVAIQESIQSVAVQSAIHDGTFDQLCSMVQAKLPRAAKQYSYRCDGRVARDMRIAFYNGDATTYQSLANLVRESNRGDQSSPAQLLEPFDPVIYQRLDPILRELYLADLLPKLILRGIGDADAIAALDKMLDAPPTKLSNELIAAAVDVYFAAGQFDRLDDLDKQFGNAMPEISGFKSLLSGDFDAARSAFEAAIPLTKKTSKKSTTAANSLCMSSMPYCC